MHSLEDVLLAHYTAVCEQLETDDDPDAFAIKGFIELVCEEVIQ